MVMAVYEHTYKPYLGKLTPEWSRFLIIPRHAFRDVFKSKLFTAFFVLCFAPLLIEAILIYLHHNVNALEILKVNVRELIPIDASFFQTFVNLQGGLAFFVTLLVGPPLVARDLRNNALPLYLCRPFSRTEYVLGKMSVLLILLSAITWVPQLLLFCFQAYLEGASWFVDNLSLASAIFIGSVVWILLLALLSQVVSALVKWRVIASATLIGIFFIPSVFGEVINNLFLTRWGNIISLSALIKNVTAGLFGTFIQASGHFTDWDGRVGREIIVNEPPLWASWFALFVICAICLALLSRKVKAYEVVR
jgi:ABC-type transport system involved in multi-copper enzyme maturation permease subunit